MFESAWPDTPSRSAALLMFNSGPAYGESVGEYRGDPLYHASLDPDDYLGAAQRRFGLRGGRPRGRGLATRRRADGVAGPATRRRLAPAPRASCPSSSGFSPPPRFAWSPSPLRGRGDRSPVRNRGMAFVTGKGDRAKLTVEGATLRRIAPEGRRPAHSHAAAGLPRARRRRRPAQPAAAHGSGSERTRRRSNWRGSIPSNPPRRRPRRRRCDVQVEFVREAESSSPVSIAPVAEMLRTSTERSEQPLLKTQRACRRQRSAGRRRVRRRIVGVAPWALGRQRRRSTGLAISSSTLGPSSTAAPCGAAGDTLR